MPRYRVVFPPTDDRDTRAEVPANSPEEAVEKAVRMNPDRAADRDKVSVELIEQ